MMLVRNDVARAVLALALDHRLLDAESAVRMLEAAGEDERALVKALLAEARLEEVLKAVSEELGVPYMDLTSPEADLRLDEELFSRFDPETLKRLLLVPMVDRGTGEVWGLAANPLDADVSSYLDRSAPGARIALASRTQVLNQLAMAASGMWEQPALGGQVDVTRRRLTQQAAAGPVQQRGPVVEWVDSLLQAAAAQGASDVHLSSQADGSILVRIRVDGKLRRVSPPPEGRGSEALGVVLTRARMDPANLFEPQDGQFSISADGRPIDVRVAMMPQVAGPTIVLRLLDSGNVRRRLDDMGFEEGHLRLLREFVTLSQGMTIVSGPTGSGKTTTLYALLREALSLDKHVATIEDPVEYRLPTVTQVQVRSVGTRQFGFAKALRSMMRMDPDVILVGEIRDTETARTALDAAITGHLVLSTVHARDALGVYTRLVEMGAPAYMVAEALTLSVAQRLIRRVHSCSVETAPSPAEKRMLERLGAGHLETIRRPGRCAGCVNTGYRGRVAVVEVLKPTADLKVMVADRVPRAELLEEARRSGFQTLAEHAGRLVAAGVTTVEEAVKVVEDVGG